MKLRKGARKLKSFIKKNKLSYRKAADEFGVCWMALYYICNGKCLPNIDTAITLNKKCKIVLTDWAK